MRFLPVFFLVLLLGSGLRAESPVPESAAAATPNSLHQERMSPEAYRLSKTIQDTTQILQLVILIVAVAMAFTIKPFSRPMLRVACWGALLIVWVRVSRAVVRDVVAGSSLHIVSTIIIYGLEWVLMVGAIYTGHHLWRTAGVDYWGIEMWKKERSKLLGYSLILIAIKVAYTRLLLMATSPVTGWSAPAIVPHGASPAEKISLILLAAAGAALLEECVFRGCFQAMFYRWFHGTNRADLSAIVLTSAFWALMHTGSMTPDWVKYAQIFPQGLLMGWWYMRAGLAGTIAVHLGFNVIVSLFPYHLS